MLQLKAPLYSSSLRAIVRQLASRILPKYKYNQPLCIIGILDAAFMFMTDFTKFVTCRDYVRVGFIKLQSYTGSKQRKLKLALDIQSKYVKGIDVLILDTLEDTGKTLTFAKNLISKKGAKTVKTCVLISKLEKPQADYVGLHLPQTHKYLVGYGLDNVDKYCRNYNYIIPVKD